MAGKCLTLEDLVWIGSTEIVKIRRPTNSLQFRISKIEGLCRDVLSQIQEASGTDIFPNNFQ
jgi:hypothetical protein